MYALMMTFKAAPGNRDAIEKLADNAFAQNKDMKGFKSEIYLFDTVNNEYGSLSIWESKEDIGTEYNIIAPIVIEPIARRIFEVYEPKE